MKIYKLINEEGLIYIGKTNNKYLSSRLAVHKSQALSSKKKYKCSSYILFTSNVNIELLEETEDNLKELYYINLYDCVNKMKTGTSYKETKKNWNNKNPEYYNLYYSKNKNGLQKIVCDCGITICASSKSRHIRTNIHKKNIVLNKWALLIKTVLTKSMDLN